MVPAGIMFTSGTTSRPKAVVHTHANALWAGRVGPQTIDMGGDDTYLVFLPFFHVNAQSWSFWTTLGVGGTVVLQPKFSASRFWDIVTAHGVTHLSLIPFVFKAIAGQPVPEHNLKVGVFGLIVPELEACSGVRVAPAYGMTETVIHATGAGPGSTIPFGRWASRRRDTSSHRRSGVKRALHSWGGRRAVGARHPGDTALPGVLRQSRSHGRELHRGRLVQDG